VSYVNIPELQREIREREEREKADFFMWELELEGLA